MFPEPSSLVPPAGKHQLEQSPERFGMAGDVQVAELMDDDVFEDGRRSEQ